MAKDKFKRVVLDLHYVVRAGDDEIERYAKDSLYEDIMNLVKYNELYDAITVIDDPRAREKDIPEFLIQEEDTSKDRFPQ